MDRVSLNPDSQQPQNFDAALHQKHATLFREGLALLTDAPPERRAPLEEMVALAEFLAERLPRLVDEWQAHRDELRTGKTAHLGPSATPEPRADRSGTDTTEETLLMMEPDLSALRERAAHGDADATAQLIELATERGDLNELRGLADAGSADATDELIQLASEQGNIGELRRLSDSGNSTATDQLIELATEQDNMDELRRLADRGNITAAEQLEELTAE